MPRGEVVPTEAVEETPEGDTEAPPDVNGAFTALTALTPVTLTPHPGTPVGEPTAEDADTPDADALADPDPVGDPTADEHDTPLGKANATLLNVTINAAQLGVPLLPVPRVAVVS
jgi:hypothetical protein